MTARSWKSLLSCPSNSRSEAFAKSSLCAFTCFELSDNKARIHLFNRLCLVEKGIQKNIARVESEAKFHFEFLRSFRSVLTPVAEGGRSGIRTARSEGKGKRSLPLLGPRLPFLADVETTGGWGRGRRAERHTCPQGVLTWAPSPHPPSVNGRRLTCVPAAARADRRLALLPSGARTLYFSSS